MHLLRSSLVMQLLITAAGQISSSVHHWRCLFFSYQGEYKAQKEAVWAIKNLTAGGTIEQIVYIVMAGALKPLCDLLVVKGPRGLCRIDLSKGQVNHQFS